MLPQSKQKHKNTKKYNYAPLLSPPQSASLLRQLEPRLASEHSAGSSLAGIKSVIDNPKARYRKRIAVGVSRRYRVLVDVDVWVGRIDNSGLSSGEVTVALQNFGFDCFVLNIFKY